MIAYEVLLCKAVIIARCLPAGLRPAPAVHCGDPGALLDFYRVDILRLQHPIGGNLSPWLEGAGVYPRGGR
jgi:hypothetical protein